MKKNIYFIFGGLAVLLTGCQNTSEDSVVSQTYIHKYGYTVSAEEWASNDYPGQVITTMSDGITVTATYEDGVLHGPCSYTHPHTQVVESYFLYNYGTLVKEIYYDVNALPVREVVYASPNRFTITLWYKNGSPLSIEEYFQQELVDGQYFTTSNEVESRVIKGNGTRTQRDSQGILIAKDEISGGFLIKKDTFYPNGFPESTAPYVKGLLHGTKKSFTIKGEPLAIEEWSFGQLHGNATYFKNGAKYIECAYSEGLKTGTEIHYNGDAVAQKTEWKNDKRHGTSSFYLDGNIHTAFYYEGKQVTHKQFSEMSSLDDKIISMNEEFEDL